MGSVKNEFLAVGDDMVKSILLLSVSIFPGFLIMLVVLLALVVAAPSKQEAFPYPTKSIIKGERQPLGNTDVLLTSATLPLFESILKVPVASADGNVVPPMSSFLYQIILPGL